MFGVGIFNAEACACYGTNTDIEEHRAAGARRATARSTSSSRRWISIEGTYKLDVAVHKRDGDPYDYHRLLYTFRVKSRIKDVGIYRPPHRWAFSPAASRSTPGALTLHRCDDDAGAVLVDRRRATWAEAPARRGPARRVHQRRVRPAAPRPRRAICSGRAAEGDALIVGVNSDRSVRANKGPSRPDPPEARARRAPRRARVRRRRRRSSTRRRRPTIIERDPARRAGERRRLGRRRDRRPRHGRGPRRPRRRVDRPATRRRGMVDDPRIVAQDRGSRRSPLSCAG